MQIIAYSSSFIPCKNHKELLTSGVVLAVNRYKCFMEKKNLIKTFSGCKPSKKTTLSIISILVMLIKKREGSGLTPKYTEYQKVNKLWQKLLEQDNVKFIN